MKKLALALSALASLLVVTACGGNGTTKPEATPDPEAPMVKINVIRQSETPKPTWVNKKWYIGKDESGAKVIFFVVQGRAATQDKADVLAQADKIVRLTEMIKQVATREFALARSGMLDPESDKALDTYFEETIAAVSKNVNVSGAMNTADYWEYVQEIEGSSSKKYYTVYKQYSMDYAIFEKARNSAWNQEKKRVDPALQNKAQSVLDSINKAEDAALSE